MLEIKLFNLKNDLDEFSKIYEESFPPSERDPLQVYIDAIEAEGTKIYLAYLKGKLIGYYTTDILENFFIIHHLYIKKEFRGNGYGLFLLNHCKSIVDLPLLLECEDDVINFYLNNGFYIILNKFYVPSFENEEILRYNLLSSRKEFEVNMKAILEYYERTYYLNKESNVVKETIKEIANGNG